MHPGFLSFFNTGLKVTVGAAAGYFGALAVSRWHASDPSEDTPPVREEHEEPKGKLDFEIQRLSGELNKREQDLKAREEVLAKQEAMLREMRAAIEADASKTQTTVVAAESDGVVAVNPTDKGAEPTIVKIVSSDPVVPPTDYVPRRPAVFDGGGNREPVVPQDPVTGEPLLLHFRDPFLGTDGRDVSTPRDVPPYLADMFKRWRFTKLRPQHIISFRATKDGWSLETPDGVSSGEYAPERDRASGDESAVSDAERKAFEEEKRKLAELEKALKTAQEAFEREKGRKEKELSDKEKDLELRKKFLSLREENKDDAADLFDLGERQRIQHAESFDMLRPAKAPYQYEKIDKLELSGKEQAKLEIEQRDDVAVDALEREENIVEIGSELEIGGEEKRFEDLIPATTGKPGKADQSNGLSFEVLAQEKEPYVVENQIGDGNDSGMTIEAQKKAPLEIEQMDKVPLDALEKPDNAVQEQEELQILRQPKPENTIELQENFNVAPLLKPKLMPTKTERGEIAALEKEAYQTQGIDELELSGKEPEMLEVEERDNVVLGALEKQENNIQRHSEFEIKGEKQPFKNLVSATSTNQSGGLSLTVPAKMKEPYVVENQIGDGQGGMTIEAQEKSESVAQNIDEIEIAAKQKQENEVQTTDEFELLGKEPAELVAGQQDEIELNALEKAKNVIQSKNSGFEIAGRKRPFANLEVTGKTGRSDDLSFEVFATKKAPSLIMEQGETVILKGEDRVIEFDEEEFSEDELDAESRKKLDELRKKRDEAIKEKEKIVANIKNTKSRREFDRICDLYDKILESASKILSEYEKAPQTKEASVGADEPLFVENSTQTPETMLFDKKKFAKKHLKTASMAGIQLANPEKEFADEGIGTETPSLEEVQTAGGEFIGNGESLQKENDGLKAELEDLKATVEKYIKQEEEEEENERKKHCQDPDEEDRANLFRRIELIEDSIIKAIAEGNVEKSVLNGWKKEFESLLTVYKPCECKGEVCEDLREEREVKIEYVKQLLKVAEVLLTGRPFGDLSESHEMSLELLHASECSDPGEAERLRIVSEMREVSDDLTKAILEKRLSRKVLSDLKTRFEKLSGKYKPCTCAGIACGTLREAREADIRHLKDLLGIAEGFVPAETVVVHVGDFKIEKVASKPLKMVSGGRFSMKEDKLLEGLKENLSASEKEKKNLKDQLEEARKTLDAKGKELSKVSKASQETERELRDLKEKMRLRDEELEKLKKELENLKKENRQLKSDNKTLSLSVERLKRENEILRGNLKDKDKEIEQLKKELKQLKDKYHKYLTSPMLKSRTMEQLFEELGELREEKKKWNLLLAVREGRIKKLENMITTHGLGKKTKGISAKTDAVPGGVLPVEQTIQDKAEEDAFSYGNSPFETTGMTTDIKEVVELVRKEYTDFGAVLRKYNRMDGSCSREEFFREVGKLRSETSDAFDKYLRQDKTNQNNIQRVKGSVGSSVSTDFGSVEPRSERVKDDKPIAFRETAGEKKRKIQKLSKENSKKGKLKTVRNGDPIDAQGSQRETVVKPDAKNNPKKGNKLGHRSLHTDTFGSGKGKIKNK